ncbi:MAG: DUF262 domain-containing protein [Chloroflexi bacterium]|nr:DUF262 domain-containing protein [Chloroflexota bacterium]
MPNMNLPEPPFGEELEDPIFDEAVESDELENVPGIERYEIGFYGTDFPVDALYKRMASRGDMDEGDIFIPDFQRGYVWSKKQADGFIESLLLGLPVPGIFLSTDRTSGRRLVIDGGQRLRTIKSFMDGEFKERVYKLGSGVHLDFQGKRYIDLLPSDRRRFDDAVIHATIVRQDHPQDGDRSLFYLFERLNTRGTPATAHEVRRSLWLGPLNDLIEELAKNGNWRQVFGRPSPRFKDQELILRFLALYFDSERYGSPNERTMKDFLSLFMARNRDIGPDKANEWRNMFEHVIRYVQGALGGEAFRPERRLNTAVFDAVMVGLAHAWAKRKMQPPELFEESYRALLQHPEFIDATTSRTSHQPNVVKRLRLAKEAFDPALANNP